MAVVVGSVFAGADRLEVQASTVLGMDSIEHLR